MKSRIFNILYAVTVCGCVSTSLPGDMATSAKLHINTEYKTGIEDSYRPCTAFNKCTHIDAVLMKNKQSSTRLSVSAYLQVQP